MTELIISYFLDDGPQLLGVERLEGIEEQLIPDFSEGGHKVSITKFFRGFDDCRWLVKNLVHTSATETSIYLNAWQNNRREEFLSQTQKSQHTVISKLQLGTLVEVEFGFIPKVKKLTGGVRSNKRYPDTIHKGEMHKRRLCVVVKARGGRVQLVPVTSQPPSSTGDLTMCQISDASLVDLIGYNDQAKSSYAIGSMIKTVALTRILPPLAKQPRAKAAFRDNRYTKKLNGPDKKAFKQALSHAVGLTDYYDLKNKVSDYYHELEKLKLENGCLTRQEALLTKRNDDLELMTRRHEALLEIMTDWQIGVSDDCPEKARIKIEKEITAYVAILNDY